MRAAEFSQSAVDSLRGRIQAPEARQAFDRMVEFGAESRSLLCAQGGTARSRDFRYKSVEPRGWPFAFTVSKAHLLFHIRPLGVRTLGLTGAMLSRQVEQVRNRADSDLSVVIRNLPEANALIENVISRWPETRAPADEVALAEAGQVLGKFRANVEQLEGACRVTGVMDRRHLRAVHMKPCDDCDDAGKLDGGNGLLLSPHVAHLFERGYVSFSDDGQLLVSRQLNSTVLKRWAITLPIAARAFVARQLPYLAWHREHVFEKAGAGRRRRG